MKNKRGKRNLAKTALVFMLALCVFISGAFVDGEVFAASEFQTSSPFSNADYSSYYHNGRFTNNLIVNGVDISEWQSKNCRFNDAKAAGVDFAIMRVTWTSYGRSALTLHNDDNFYSQYLNAKNNGVMTGVYVFSQAKNATEGAQEANFAISRLKALGIGPKDLELPLYMDYEFAGRSSGKNKGRLYGLTKAKAIEAVNAFANVVRANGYDPGVYANTNFFKSYLNNGVGLALWCAQYYSMNQSPSNYNKWQYTSTAHVDGILYYSTNKIGSTDADFWYLNRKANGSPITTIYGNTNLNYTGNPVRPTLEIYAGSTLLKEGTDYVVGGINNINKGAAAYAYVKGIGKYGGYALVPVTIGSGFIGHIGLSSAGIANTNGGKYSIGSNSYGSFVRNVPAGTKAGDMLGKLKAKKDSHSLAIIDAYGKKVDKKTVVATGMMVGVYSGSTLKGTADITVNGSAINNTGANYICKANRGAYVSTAGTAAKANAMKVDGIGGKGTVKALQAYLGVKQTGKITVKKSQYKYCKSFKSVKKVKKAKKDPTVMALQKWLGIKADGVWGKGTSKALQKRLGVKANGKFGKSSMKALQKYLNSVQ